VVNGRNTLKNANTITRLPKWHELKSWPEIFNWMISGAKMFDARKNDRDYQCGDYLILREWNQETSSYTGRQITRQVTYILGGGKFGLPENMVIMQLRIT
jgi:hypothetical protein